MDAAGIDSDTLAAVRKRWSEETTLPSLLAELPQAGRLPSPQPSRPYAAIKCEYAKREAVNNLRAWFDFRKVTIDVYGIKAEVDAAVAAVKSVFNTAVVLAYPSGAIFRRWWPEASDKLELTPEKKDGEDVWKSTIEATVWSVRVE